MSEMDFEQIIDDVLGEHDLSAEQLLAAMVRVMVERHVDVELRRLGRREPYPIHNERADALKAVNDAVHQAQAREKNDVLQAVISLLIQCQFAAEKAAGIGEDEDDEPPMRLVTD